MEMQKSRHTEQTDEALSIPGHQCGRLPREVLGEEKETPGQNKLGHVTPRATEEVPQDGPGLGPSPIHASPLILENTSTGSSA